MWASTDWLETLRRGVGAPKLRARVCCLARCRVTRGAERRPRVRGEVWGRRRSAAACAASAGLVLRPLRREMAGPSPAKVCRRACGLRLGEEFQPLKSPVGHRFWCQRARSCRGLCLFSVACRYRLSPTCVLLSRRRECFEDEMLHKLLKRTT